jgi:hypothetical protein
MYMFTAKSITIVTSAPPAQVGPVLAASSLPGIRVGSRGQQDLARLRKRTSMSKVIIGSSRRSWKAP